MKLDDLVLRRIPGLWVVEGNDGKPRPSGQAFDNDRDGVVMSAYLDSALAEQQLTRRQVLTGHENFFLAAVLVEVFLNEEQRVVRDPVAPPMHPCDGAHVSVVGVKGTKRRRRFAKSAMWVEGMSPPGADARITS